MEADSITPEEYRKLQMQVDILERFLIKMFGSTFQDFCKGMEMGSPVKDLPQMRKAQSPNSSDSTSNLKIVKVERKVKGHTSMSTPSTSLAGARRPPPLLPRPNKTAVKSGGSDVPTISAGTSRAVRTSTNSKSSVITADEGDGEGGIEFDEDWSEEDLVQFIHPEVVFSEDEQRDSRAPSGRKSSINRIAGTRNGRGGMKRDHAAAFGYYDNADNENDEKTQLSEGTGCIKIDTDDQGQQKNYSFQHEDEENFCESEVDNNEEADQDGTEGAVKGAKYSTEELYIDGIKFGTVISAQEKGIQYFQCSFCTCLKVFKHRQSLREHYLLNHSATTPAFHCQCGRRFLKVSQLKRHEVVHTAERPYVCPICFKDFTRRDNMTVHMVRSHAQKKHTCHICPDKVYASSSGLKKHLRTYHHVCDGNKNY